MKLINICGLSAVGKNFLLRKIREIYTKDPSSRSEFENTLMTRFEIRGNCEFPDPVSTGYNRELSHLQKDLEDIVEAGRCDTVIHRWQFRSSKIIPIASRILPDYEQKTFVIWLDPVCHLNQALTFRFNGKDYKAWSRNYLVKRFAGLMQEVLFYVKKSYGDNDEESQEEIDIANIPSQISKYGIEVITSISPHIYATVSEENLKFILKPDR